MSFIYRKIQEKSTPFLKEKLLNKKPNPRLFFGPEIIWQNKGKIILARYFSPWLIVFLIIVVYLFFSLKSLFSPPEIIVYLPEDNYLTHEKMIKIKGRIKGEAIVTINDQIVTLNQNSFEETLMLSPGINLIKISARKKFSPEKVVFRRIIVE
ncbi:MAG: hypothetical protein N2259_02190 [Patescibacteria group bacterium]|nr:hypothetical protein [Patescibacteria group bacterium]